MRAREYYQGPIEKIGEGEESIVYKVHNGNEVVASKWYKEQCGKTQRKKKLKKLILCKSSNLPSYINSPLEIICENDILQAYEQQYFPYPTLQEAIAANLLSIRALYSEILKLKQQIFELYRLGIGYFDIGSENIIITPSKSVLIDTCNCQIGGIDPEITKSELSDYLNNGGKLNLKGLTFAFNVFTLQEIQKYNFDFVQQTGDINNFILQILFSEVDTVTDSEFLIDYLDECKTCLPPDVQLKKAIKGVIKQ